MEIPTIDPTKVDYSKLNLNKLSDAEIKAHKKAMDTDYNKNFVGKNNPNFQYDKRIDFKQMRD